LNPYDGQLVALLLPYMTKECFRIFMEYFEQETQEIYGEEEILMILDGASNHQSDVISSKRILLEKLPPACPELNPAERFFEQLRTELSNLVFDELEQVEEHLIKILQKYYENPQLICSLTHFPYIRH
jgi:transposase